jgi:hypothetical protein
MSVHIERVTATEVYDRFLANLDDAEMNVYEFLALKHAACHLTCVRDWHDDRWIAIEEADRWFGLLGGEIGLAAIWDTPAEWGMTA